MSAPEPILDYAKPTTPDFGVVYELQEEELPDGVRYTLPPKGLVEVSRMYRILWFASAASVVFAGMIILACIIRPRGLDPSPRGAVICIALAVLFPILAAYHRRTALLPRVLDIRKSAIQLTNPVDILSRVRVWNPRRVRHVQVVHRGIALETGKPIADLRLTALFLTHSLFSALNPDQLHGVAESIRQITRVRVK